MACREATYYVPVLKDDHTRHGRYYDAFRDFWRTSFPNREAELQVWNDQWERVRKDTWDLMPGSESAASATSSPAPEECADVSQSFVHEPDGKPKFQVQVNAKDFKPEDVLVSMMQNQLHISAKSEKRNAKNLKECREFSKCFDLPPNVVPETLSSSLSSDGVLSITAHISSLNDAVTDDPGRPQLRDAVVAMDAASATGSAADGSRPIFAFQLPVVGFFPEEIAVETRDRVLSIKGSHEERHSGGLQTKYSFCKSYVLPPSVNKEQLRVCLSDGRVVVAEAPHVEPQRATVELQVEHK